MNTDLRGRTDDPFLKNYSDDDLRVASEFLTNWLPFLSRNLCNHCTQTISDRIRSLHSVVDGIEESPLNQEENLVVSTPDCMDLHELNEKNQEIGDTRSSEDGANLNDFADTDSMPASETVGSPSGGGENGVESVRMSWADMAQEGELNEEGEVQGDREKSVARELDNDSSPSGAVALERKVGHKPELSREQREYIRFNNVKRKKDFVCLEKIKGKDVNIVEGLELHTGVFSAAEQKRIVDCVEKLHEMGMNGQLRARTYTAPQKWMRGKGRVTIQFGCCYNYAIDRNGNPPGILQTEPVDPIPPLLKVMIKRLVAWHVLPPSCVPDSCIVNIYEEGDCIPPHIDNHDFVRPFCTVSFLSECNIVFGSNLKIVGPGEFSGPLSIPLPVGSVLVLNGNGADVAKHAVPAVPTKRISITFRKMDKLKRPFGFVLERDLQGIQPLPYGTDKSQRQTPNMEEDHMNKEETRKEDSSRDQRARGSFGRATNYSDQRGFSNKRRVRVDLSS